MVWVCARLVPRSDWRHCFRTTPLLGRTHDYSKEIIEPPAGRAPRNTGYSSQLAQVGLAIISPKPRIFSRNSLCQTNEAPVLLREKMPKKEAELVTSDIAVRGGSRYSTEISTRVAQRSAPKRIIQ